MLPFLPCQTRSAGRRRWQQQLPPTILQLSQRLPRLWLLLLLVAPLPPPRGSPVSLANAQTTFGWEELDTKLPKAISDHTATRYGQIVYLAGGCDAENGNTWNEDARRFLCLSVSQSFYSFDLSPGASNMTQILPDMPVRRYRHAAVAVHNKVFLVGGRDFNDSIVEQVDVSTVVI